MIEEEIVEGFAEEVVLGLVPLVMTEDAALEDVTEEVLLDTVPLMLVDELILEDMPEALLETVSEDVLDSVPEDVILPAVELSGETTLEDIVGGTTPMPDDILDDGVTPESNVEDTVPDETPVPDDAEVIVAEIPVPVEVGCNALEESPVLIVEAPVAVALLGGRTPVRLMVPDAVIDGRMLERPVPEGGVDMVPDSGGDMMLDGRVDRLPVAEAGVDVPDVPSVLVSVNSVVGIDETWLAMLVPSDDVGNGETMDADGVPETVLLTESVPETVG